MPRRVTIMISDKHDKKLREIQSKTISKTTASYSFSQCLNDQLEKVLK